MSERSQAGTGSPSRGKPGPHPALCASLSRFAGEGLERWCLRRDGRCRRGGRSGPPYCRARGLRTGKIGRGHVCTPVTNAHLVCRLLLEKKKQTKKNKMT